MSTVLLYSSIGSSVLGSTERGVDSGDATTSVNMNNVAAQVNIGEVVMIKVDAAREWTGSCVPVPLVLGYGWAPQKIGE